MSVVKFDFREHTLFIFFILKKHILLLLLLYSKKVDPLQFQTIPYLYLYDQHFLVLFVVIFDPRRLIIVTVIKFQAVLDLVCCNRYLRAVE